MHIYVGVPWVLNEFITRAVVRELSVLYYLIFSPQVRKYWH